MTPFQVSQACWDIGLRSGAIVFRDVRIAESSTELREEITKAIGEIRASYTSMAEIRSLPEISGFYEILRRVKVDPRKLSPTIERLTRQAIKQGVLPEINNLVDLYNLVSLRTRFSIGAHDLSMIELPVELRILEEEGLHTPLGSSYEVKIDAGEFAYMDALKRIICRLDIQQADFSKVTSKTNAVLMVIEGTSSHTRDKLSTTVQLCIELVDRFCKGKVEEIVEPIWD